LGIVGLGLDRFGVPIAVDIDNVTIGATGVPELPAVVLLFVGVSILYAYGRARKRQR
jgi:hypothetical protein